MRDFVTMTGPGLIETSMGVTLREIIRNRVQQEVARFNEADYEVFQGLVQPEESERVPQPRALTT